MQISIYETCLVKPGGKSDLPKNSWTPGDSQKSADAKGMTDLMLYGVTSACDNQGTKVMPKKEQNDHWPFNCICYK